MAVVERSVSTQADLAARVRSIEPADRIDGIVLVADHQTAGRGRLDRTWTTPARSALTLSVLLRPDGVDVARWPWLALLTGLVVAATLRDQAGVEALVKWPNDVLIGERKVAGILVERVETSGGAVAVVGIGVNVSLRADELPVPEATSLALESTTTTDRSVLLRALLRNLGRVYRDWVRHAGDPGGGLRASYVEACTTIGRRVRVELASSRSLTGRAVGLDRWGRLLVSVSGAEHAVAAGDVVHLRPAP